MSTEIISFLGVHRVINVHINAPLSPYKYITIICSTSIRYSEIVDSNSIVKLSLAQFVNRSISKCNKMSVKWILFMEHKKINITNRQVALAYCIITVYSSVLWGKLDKCSRQAGRRGTIQMTLGTQMHMAITRTAPKLPIMRHATRALSPCNGLPWIDINCRSIPGRTRHWQWKFHAPTR